MDFDTFATDFDGTLAHDGYVDDATLLALQHARDASLRLVLVTGRELTSLANTFPHAALFDRIVAENGAVLFDPSTQTSRVLGPPPPPALLERLTHRNVPLSIGHSIVATVTPYQQEVADAIGELASGWHIVLNKEAVMVLPRDVDKATGLKHALDELGGDVSRTVAIGDAENDEVFLNVSGLGVAVANALDSLKRVADVVTTGERGRGVVECLERLRRGEFDGMRSVTR